MFVVNAFGLRVQVGGPYWDVPVGRKDSKTASFAEVETNIPGANIGLLSIIAKFIYQGLSVTDMVALSGKQTQLIYVIKWVGRVGLERHFSLILFHVGL